MGTQRLWDGNCASAHQQRVLSTYIIGTLRGVGGGGVGGLNAHNKDLIRPIYGSIVPYPPPPYPPKGPYEDRASMKGVYDVAGVGIPHVVT